MVLQVHPRERGECGRLELLALRPVPVARAERRHLAGQLGGAAQPSPQGLCQRQMAEAVNADVLLSCRDCSGHPGIEDTGRLIETA